MQCYVGYKKTGMSCIKDSEILEIDNIDSIASEDSSIENRSIELEFWRSIKDSNDVDEYIAQIES